MKKLYRTNEGCKIAGVCTGLGEYFEVDPVIVRVVFLVLIVCGGIGILTYLIMWLLVPLKGDDKSSTQFAKRLYLSASDKKIAGVCGGLGEFCNLDPVIFRIGFVVLTFLGGIGTVLYIVFWLVLPQKDGFQYDQ